MPEDQHSLYVKLTETLVLDYRNLASETKRKFVQIKDAAEKQITWLRSCVNSNDDIKESIILNNMNLLDPFLNGCTTKQPKIVIISLTSLQKLINLECLSEDGAGVLIDVLWILMTAGVEELRVLQTAILLLTTSSLVKGDMLAKTFSLCWRLHTSKIPATVNTAAAAIRQCASAVFDRVCKEQIVLPNDGAVPVQPKDVQFVDEVKLEPATRDAYRLFRDICALLNDDDAVWLPKLSDINRPLGLELVESLISQYAELFRQHVAFAYLLKTNLCPLVIKLFSPSLKLRSTPSSTSTSLSEMASAAIAAVVQSGSSSNSPASSNSHPGVTPMSAAGDKIQFAIMARLQRLIAVIVDRYFNLLNTECEIYLSLLIRFLDVDKLSWQRALALEVLGKFTSQPNLLRHICMSYDMRQHSTKIFHELINALSHYIQIVLASPAAGDDLTKDQNQSTSSGVTSGQNQSMLYYKGSFFPIVICKSPLLDMLDRSEAPVLPDGYCLSQAFYCLLRTVRSLEHTVNESSDEDQSGSDLVNESVKTQLVSLSWCSLLSAFALLLESSADDKITASILQALHTMTGLCGQLGVETARDSFVTTLCRCALPSSVAWSSLIGPTIKTPLSNRDETFERSPVVIVVTQGAGHQINVTTKSVALNTPTGSQMQTTLSTTSSTVNAESCLAASSGSLCLTAKHLQAARTVLTTAQIYGDVMGSAWTIVLSTLQNLVWMLGLRIEPVAVLYFKPHTESAGLISNSATAAQSASVAKSTGRMNGATLSSSTSVSDELALLSSMLSALFVESCKLQASALNDLVMGLCQLTSETMEAASVNKEPSPFPVAKLTEVGLVNIGRLNLWWDSVSSQLLSLCKLAHTDLRQLSVNALVTLIKQAIAAPQSPMFWKNECLTSVVLDPLSALSEVTYDDVREQQLGCVQQMLHCWGEHIGTSWIRLIEIIGVMRDSFTVELIQIAFQCFKLIVSDYLSSLLPNCYLACIETAARFGQQQQDLNIALTAIGTMLHLADYILQMETFPEVADSSGTILSLTDLWISMFQKLATLCLDRRSTIRKSSCQTLFNMIECHSLRRFNPSTWSALFWQVMFPLVRKVQQQYSGASIEREGRQNSLLIHHSRDTAAKQWSETVVLTLSGISNLFVSKQKQLLVLDEFPKIWSALLAHLQSHALTTNSEISVTALTCFQSLLDLEPLKPEQVVTLWRASWMAWLQIATNAVDLKGDVPDTFSASLLLSGTNEEKQSASCTGSASTNVAIFLPTASFMTLLFDLFPLLFPRILPQFTSADFSKLDRIIRLGVLTPLHVTYLYPRFDGNPTSTIDDAVQTQLQTSVLRTVHCLLQNIEPADCSLRLLLPSLIHLLLALASYSVQIPKPEKCPPGRMDFIPRNYIGFAEKCLQIAVDTYMSATYWDDERKIEILQAVVKTLHEPMALKYGCASQSTWLLASRCFFQVISTTLPLLALKNGTKKPGKDFAVITVVTHNCLASLPRFAAIHQPENLTSCLVQWGSTCSQMV